MLHILSIIIVKSMASSKVPSGWYRAGILPYLTLIFSVQGGTQGLAIIHPCPLVWGYMTCCIPGASVCTRDFANVQKRQQNQDSNYKSISLNCICCLGQINGGNYHNSQIDTSNSDASFYLIIILLSDKEFWRCFIMPMMVTLNMLIHMMNWDL